MFNETGFQSEDNSKDIHAMQCYFINTGLSINYCLQIVLANLHAVLPRWNESAS